MCAGKYVRIDPVCERVALSARSLQKSSIIAEFEADRSVMNSHRLIPNMGPPAVVVNLGRAVSPPPVLVRKDTNHDGLANTCCTAEFRLCQPGRLRPQGVRNAPNGFGCRPAKIPARTWAGSCHETTLTGATNSSPGKQPLAGLGAGVGGGGNTDAVSGRVGLCR